MTRKLILISALLFGLVLTSWTAFPQSAQEDPGVLRLKYATIVVPDYDEALRWYTDVLGLEKVQ